MKRWDTGLGSFGLCCCSAPNDVLAHSAWRMEGLRQILSWTYGMLISHLVEERLPGTIRALDSNTERL